MPRIFGARLAVPLTIITTLLIVVIDAVSPRLAGAADGCRTVSGGVVCTFAGRTVTVSTSVRRSTTGGTATPLPPRYPAVSPAGCWYWTRAPAGLTSHARSLFLTNNRLPQCGSSPVQAARRTVIVDVETTAWSIFRSFPLHEPRFGLSPVIGITNLPSRLHLERPQTFDHSETLPDGRRLEVEAEVGSVVVDWSDGSSPERHGLEAIGDPGTARHTYLLKTCPPAYRTSHLDGPKCHPYLTAYPVTVTLEWTARYRVGDEWIPLGSIDLSATTDHDVDEVLGVLTAPDAT